VHDGISGAHQLANRMKWLLRRAGFYWATMVVDCIKYQKGCEACQWFGNIQLAPAGVMNSIVKPWPFRGVGDLTSSVRYIPDHLRVTGLSWLLRIILHIRR
jgi:hypothetical protein